MLTITPEAEEWITNQLTEAKAPDEVALRLFEKEGQIQMGVAEPKEEDITFDRDGKTYLAVGPAAGEKLDGKSLCCQDSAQGKSLAIASPPPAE